MTDRTKYIGGSDISAVIGISPWTTPLDLYFRKRAEAPEQADSAVLRRGRLLEPYVRTMYAEKTGRKVLEPVFVVGSEPWIAASLDGMSTAPDDSDSRVLEIKTARESTLHDWGEEGSDDIPVYYTAQVQWQLLCTRLPRADLAALIGIDNFRIYTIEAEPALQATLVAKARAFWQAVQQGTPPEPVNSDDMAHLFPRSFAGTVEADDTDLAAVNELRRIRQEAAALEGEAEILRFKIERRLGEAEALVMDGKPLVTWKTQERKTVDLKALAAAHPDIADQFRHAQTSRVFRIR